MIILGINGGFRQGYQDVSACLIKDGELIAAVEEERLSRIKFSPGRLPYLSVIEVLKIAKIRLKDVNLLAFHGSTWEPEIEERIHQYFESHFGCAPPIKRFHHHDCHAASTYYASGYNQALIVTIDNSGDGISMQISEGIQGKIKEISRFSRPNSLGIFYSIITQYCGFTRDQDEYKLMGLSSYGNRSFMDFSWLIDFNEGNLTIDTSYLVKIPPKAPSPHKDEMIYSQEFVQTMGRSKRIPKTTIDSFYMDVAASAQEHFERLMIKVVKYYLNKTGHKKICLAGGAALNCVMNQHLMNLEELKEIFVQPASSDAGISLGAGWLAGLERGVTPLPPKNYYTGNQYSNDEIKSILDTNQIAYYFEENIIEKAAEYLAENKVLGWFQGGMEFGPRALGNRSILANPTNPKMQDIVNQKIKFRENFRPFCPSVLEEDVSVYFEGKQTVSPYMNVTFDTNDYALKEIPAVCHVDRTARIQSVNRDQNSLFYDLLRAFKDKSGHGVLLNTSFNLSHEPIVCTPRDALASFYACGLDVLFLGNYVIKKHEKLNNQPALPEKRKHS